MTDLREPSLSPWWQDKLNDLMEQHFPEIIGHWSLVDAWKVDGWNDGTATLFGVYQSGVKFRLCKFPDYADPTTEPARPILEHTGWHNPINDKEGRDDGDRP